MDHPLKSNMNHIRDDTFYFKVARASMLLCEESTSLKTNLLGVYTRKRFKLDARSG